MRELVGLGSLGCGSIDLGDILVFISIKSVVKSIPIMIIEIINIINCVVRTLL